MKLSIVNESGRIYTSEPDQIEANPGRTSILAFLLHDIQTPVWNYMPRSLFDPNDRLRDTIGYPEMVPFTPRMGVKQTEKLQWFWVKQLILSKYKKEVNNKAEFLSRLTSDERTFIVWGWRGLTGQNRAFTNGKGTDNCWDFIGEVINPSINSGKGASLPVLWENSCGGTTVELFDTNIYRDGYKVKTLKVSDYEIWKNWTFLTHPQYFTIATNSRPDYTVTHFHWLHGPPVPVPIMNATGYVYVKPNRVRLLSKTEPIPKVLYP